MLTKEETLDDISCPHCGKPIPINETVQKHVYHQVRAEFEADNLQQQKKMEERERALAEKENSVDRVVADRLKDEKVRIEQEAEERSKADIKAQLEEMSIRETSQVKKLQEASERERALIREKQEAEDRAQAATLEAARQVDAERSKIRDEAALQADEKHRLKDAEYERKIQALLKVNEDMNRKLQQGSQQMQGEVLELELEGALKSAFPVDIIEEVAKGVKGADVMETVVSPSGRHCGTSVWELKRTKNWSEGWVQTLKDNQRRVKADIAILVSEVLPKEVKNFAHANGIWIATPQCVLGLATALRMHLIDLETTKLAAVGKNEKMEILYKYLSGSEFRQRVEAIVEAFVEMQNDLHSERRIAEVRWAKREKQIQMVISNTSGMYGDFHGLLGSSLQAIPALEAGQI